MAMEISCRSKRPSSSIESISTFNTLNSSNIWVPTKIQKGSWIIMQQTKRKKQRSHNHFILGWKGRVKDFRMGPNKRTIKEVLVQHVYMHKELHINPTFFNLPLHRPNYLYPSNLEDWQPVECIIDLIDVLHSSIGEQMYKGRTGGSLAENGVFFYDHFYVVPSNPHCHGSISRIALPDFKSGEWTLPSQVTSEGYRCKIFNEIQKCLKTNIASKQCRISMFMPLDIFVDFFSQVEVRRCKTMFSVKGFQDHNLLEFVDEGWNEKVENGIHCRVHMDSIACKYMIASQNFILTLYYSRWHIVYGRRVPLDQNLDDFEDNPIVDIDVWMDNDILCNVKLREQCTLKQLRIDLEIEEYDVPASFSFTINKRNVNLLQLLLSV